MKRSSPSPLTSKPGSRNSVWRPSSSTMLMQVRVSPATCSKSCAMPCASSASSTQRPECPPTRPVARLLSPIDAITRATFRPLPPGVATHSLTRSTSPG